MTPLLIGLAGGLGAAARYSLDSLIQARQRTTLPIGTVIINVLGSALIGILLGLSWSGSLRGQIWNLGAVGLLGGFTTASTISYEAVRLGEEGRIKAAVAVSIFTLVSAVGAATLTATVFG
ncbi:MAG: CrcB family protein, partial [Actinomycetota bacterium]